MKKVVCAFLIFLVFIIVTYLIINSNKDIGFVCFENNCFSVEIAKTQEEKQRGLMFRQELKENKGMLFVYEAEGNYSFWMKNTLIPLDIIWINSNLEVVDIKTVYPCKTDFCEAYYSKERARYVLEINANKSKELELNIGDKLEFS